MTHFRQIFDDTVLPLGPTRPVLGLSKLLVGSNLMLDFVTKHCRLRPVCVDFITQQHHRPWLTIRCTHGCPSKILKLKIAVQNSPCLKKKYRFSKLSCCISRDNCRVWVLYIDDLLALNYHFRKLRSHDPSSLRIAPRSSGLGYVGWEPNK